MKYPSVMNCPTVSVSGSTESTRESSSRCGRKTDGKRSVPLSMYTKVLLHQPQLFYQPQEIIVEMQMLLT